MRRTSRLIAVINGLMRLAPPRLRRRDPEQVFTAILRAAASELGDHASLPDADAEGYRRLLEGYASAPGLSPLGWTMVTADLQARIINHLHVNSLHARYPGIGREQVRRPIVIVGLPRTGTTLVHRLLGESPGHRAPALWELLHTGLDDPEADARTIATVDAQQRLWHRLAPVMPDIHHQEARQADEDVWALPHGRGLVYLSRVAMPAYEAWCSGRSLARDYDHLLRVYQVLQCGRVPRRWVIKAPVHLDALTELVRVFPDAQLVWLHRDPLTVMGSMCSLVETAHRAHGRTDLAAIGQLCLRHLAAMIRTGRADRHHLRPGQIIDVPYYQLTARPKTTVPTLFDQLGAVWTAHDAANLERRMGGPHGRRHEYELGRYGLTPTDVEDAFGDYSRWVTNLESRTQDDR